MSSFGLTDDTQQIDTFGVGGTLSHLKTFSRKFAFEQNHLCSLCTTLWPSSSRPPTPLYTCSSTTSTRHARRFITIKSTTTFKNRLFSLHFSFFQFWVHTEVVGNLGPLEAIFNTASRHRVHHGIYLCTDKKIKNFPHILGNSDGIGCKVIYEEGLRNI